MNFIFILFQIYNSLTQTALALPANLLELNLSNSQICNITYSAPKFYSQEQDQFWKTIAEHPFVKRLSIKPDEVSLNYQLPNGGLASFNSRLEWKTGITRIVFYQQLPPFINKTSLIIESIIRMRQFNSHIKEVQIALDRFPEAVLPEIKSIQASSLAKQLLELGFDEIEISDYHGYTSIVHFKNSKINFKPEKREGYFKEYHQTPLPFLEATIKDFEVDLKSSLNSKIYAALNFINNLTFGDEFYLGLEKAQDLETKYNGNTDHLKKARALQSRIFQILYEYILNHPVQTELSEKALHTLVNYGIRNSLIDFKNTHPAFKIFTSYASYSDQSELTYLWNSNFFKEHTKSLLITISKTNSFSTSVRYRANTYLNFISP